MFPPANLYAPVPVAAPVPLTISVTVWPAAASVNAGNANPELIVTDLTFPFATVSPGESFVPSASIVSA